MKTLHLSPDRPTREHYALLACWCGPIRITLRYGYWWRKVRLIIHHDNKETP